jgi:hypothetical protein
MRAALAALALAFGPLPAVAATQGEAKQALAGAMKLVV